MGWRDKDMLSAIIVVGVLAFVLNRRGYSIEKMMPILIVAGLIAFFIPVVGIIAWPFKLIGGILHAVIGATGAIIGGIGGIVGGIVGIVFGVVGAVVGLVLGLVGLAWLWQQLLHCRF